MFNWSILVCCHNSAKRISHTLKAIAQQTVAATHPVELVVVDNASTDDTVEVVRNYSFPPNIKLSLVSEPRPGLSNARRAAIAASRGRYLCFIDDDNDPDDNYLEAAQRLFEADSEVSFCGGRSSWPVGGAWSNLPLVARYFSKAVAVGSPRSGAKIKLGTGEYLWGAGVCLRRAEIAALYEAGFEPLLSGRVGKRMLSGEDGELVILMQLLGGRGLYSQELHLTHRVDVRRLTVGTYSQLFTGMGIAAPTVGRYQREVREVARVVFNSESSLTGVSRSERLAGYSMLERATILLLYFWLSLAWLRGVAIGHFVSPPSRATEQVRRLATRLGSTMRASA